MKIFGLGLIISKDGIGFEPEPRQNFPYPKTTGIIISLRGGDMVFPWGGNWFSEPYFKHVLHFYMPIPILPYVTIQIGRWGFYGGFKAFGVDSPAYKNWLDPKHVYEGSVAIQPSFRFSLSRGRENPKLGSN